MNPQYVVPVAARISRQQQARLVQMAQQQQRSIASLIREAIAAYVVRVLPVRESTGEQPGGEELRKAPSA